LEFRRVDRLRSPVERRGRKAAVDMKKENIGRRIRAGLLACAMALSLVPGRAFAVETEILPEVGESVSFSGKVLAAVNTVLDSESLQEGSFASLQGLGALPGPEMTDLQAYNVYTDPETGEDLIAMEPIFDPLVPKKAPTDGSHSLPEPRESSYAVGSTRTIRDSEDIIRSVQCLYSGTYCTVWGGTDDPSVIRINAEIAREVGEQFDGYYPKVVAAFGNGYDADGDGKVAILCYDIDDDYNNGFTSGGYTAGYFYAADMVDSSGYVNGVYFGTSHYYNNLDVIHLDTFPGMGGVSAPLGDISRSYSTLVHEYQHLINFSAQVARGASGYFGFMETYLNEAFSMAAEHMICGEDACSSRISYFNSSYISGYPLTYWGGSLSNYAHSYLFGQYLRTRYGALTGTNGNTLFQTVLKARNPANAADTIGVIAQLLETDPTQLVLDFWAAVYLKQPSGVYGFGGESWANAIDPYIYSSPYSGTDEIYNGGAKFYSLSGGAFEPSSRNNVVLMSLSDSGVEHQDGLPVASGISLKRTSVDEAAFTVTSSQNGWLYYAVSDEEITDREELSEKVSVKKDTPLTLELDISGGEDASPTLYYYLMNAGGEYSKLAALTVPAYTYPITITPSDRGTVRVYWDGEQLQSGDRVINGETLTVSAEPYDGYTLTAIHVDGKTLGGTSLQVTGAHTISAVFVQKDVSTADGFAFGSGTQADPYLITDTSELKYLSLRVNSGDSMEGKYVALDTDLDLEGAVFAPIGASEFTPFAGTFDGQGHTLSNLYMALEGAAYGGLFGYLTGTVENLRMEDFNLMAEAAGATDGCFGAIAGLSEGEIAFCAVIGVEAGSSIIADGYATLCLGGLCGFNMGALEDSVSQVDYTVCDTGETAYTVCAGGLVGRNYGTVARCESQGVGTGFANSSYACLYQGGLVGYSMGDVTDSLCLSGGSVFSEGTAYLGGAVGYQNSGSLTKCVVYAPDSMLEIEGAQVCTGGLVGYYYSGTLRYCAVTLDEIWSAAEDFYNYEANHLGYVFGSYNTNGSIKYSNCYYVESFELNIGSNATTQPTGNPTSAADLVDEEFLSSAAYLDFTEIWEIGKRPETVHPTLQSHRQLLGHFLTVLQPENGTVSVDDLWVYAGMEVTVTAQPDAGYYLKSILVDGEPLEGNTFIAEGPHRITAEFFDGYIVTLIETENCIALLSSDRVAPGGTVEVTVYPDVGYRFLGLLVNGVFLPDACRFAVTEDCRVEPVLAEVRDDGSYGAVVTVETQDAHTARATVAAGQEGYALVAFYGDGGKLLEIRLFEVELGVTVLSIEETRVSLNACDWKIILTDGGYIPVCDEPFNS